MVEVKRALPRGTLAGERGPRGAGGYQVTMGQLNSGADSRGR